ncbi:Protein of unknown function [Vibrio xiamenensis]|uniref:DUF3301 domain-containing protein n=1 Tax=Vibrio xiamenensis TaxID=861298 RepID=A0A1G8EC77_9VIBR|nr:DUF3301 domain-containing protein [Vibrio xiamenensis]SDH67493.1 Protein of unknown function [Vibrio xiamenensis]
MIADLLAILAVSFGCLLFWQQRRQAEIAKAAIARKCQQLELQLVSVALGSHKLKTPEGLWRFHTVYQFEFSSLGDDCYQGKLTMLGFKPVSFDLPPHRL